MISADPKQPDSLVCVSPLSGEPIAVRRVQSGKQVQDQLSRARQAQKDWQERSVSFRSSVVLCAFDVLESMNDEITVELAQMIGRPVRYGGEINGVQERVRYMASIAERALAPDILEVSSSVRRQIINEPLGVVFAIAPWNYPYLTSANTIAPALIAGNAVFLKHSTQSILAGERIEQAFLEAGLPDGLFCNLFLTHPTTIKLISAGAFDFVNFTGSVNAGRLIERAAAEGSTPVTLELGGKDAGYVREDADLETTVPSLVDGAMFNSGQCCCGIERIYVHESRYDEFVALTARAAASYVLGDPTEESTTLGPMAKERFAHEVRTQISEAIAAGSTALVDQALFPLDTGDTAYLAPQVLVNVDHSMRVMRDESFGPIVGIMKVKNDEEAIELVNDSVFGLTASLWTSDFGAASELGRQINVGTVYMNRCDYVDPALCWTGRKDTGRGVSLSARSYLSLTRPKSYHLRMEA